MTSGLLVIAIASLVLVQGGFFPLASCVAGVVVCSVAGVAWLRGSRESRGIPVVALLFLGVALAHLASAVVNGATLTTLSKTGVWAACAGAAFLAATQDSEKRAFWMRLLAWFGVATAVAGVLVCAGVLPLPGGMTGSRLQFTFQYANAAAAWYGAIALLCLLSSDGRLNAFAALPVSALLLTQSGGGLLFFAIVLLVACVRLGVEGRWMRLAAVLAQTVLAVILFAATHAVSSPVAVIALVIVTAICWWFGKTGLDAASADDVPFDEAAPGKTAAARLRALVPHIDYRKAAIVLAAVSVVCVVVGLALFSDRVSEAIGSFGERACQASDGMSLWLTQPLLGVGPDNWQYLYQYIQTAPYYTTVVHCSYVQMLLDAGVVGLGFFLAACVMGLRRFSIGENSRPGRCPEFYAAVFLLAHALIDFDFQFSALSLLVVLLLSRPEGLVLNARGAARWLSGLSCLVVCLPVCLTGLLCASSAAALERAGESGDYEACARLLEENSLAQGDVAAQSHCLNALYRAGEYAEVTASFETMIAPADGDVLHAALAYEEQGDHARATEVLAERLEEHPYDADFLESALQFVETYDLDPSQSARFLTAASAVRDNVEASGLHG